MDILERIEKKLDKSVGISRANACLITTMLKCTVQKGKPLELSMLEAAAELTLIDQLHAEYDRL